MNGMDGVDIVSCHSFNGNIRSIGSEKSNFFSNGDIHSSDDGKEIINADHRGCGSMDVSKPTCPAYDEDFVVNGDEDVSTPRSSPTLLELRKMLEEYKPMSTSAHRLRERNDSGKTTSEFIRSLKEVASRPCQYPLDKFYDEAIPVRGLQRSIIKGVRLGHDKTTMSENNCSRNRPFVPHPPVRHLDGILPKPTSPLPRFSSYCSSSGSLIGNMNGIPLPGDNLFMSNNLFPPTLSKSIIDESRECQSMDNELQLDAKIDTDKCESDVRRLVNDNVSEESELLTPSDDISSPGTTLNLEKVEPVTSSTSSYPSSAFTDDASVNKAVKSAEHLSVPQKPTQPSKSKHSKRSKPRSPKCSLQAEDKISKSLSQNINQRETSNDVTSAVQVSDPSTSTSVTHLSSTHSCSVQDENHVHSDTKSVLQNGDLSQIQHKVNGSLLASSRASTQEDLSADDDFTLVTNKKNRRKLKLERQQELHTRPPTSSIIGMSTQPPISSTVNRPVAINRSLSGMLHRGSSRKPLVTGVSSSYRLALPTTAGSKVTTGLFNQTTLRKNTSQKSQSVHVAYRASVSGQSDGSMDSRVSNATTSNSSNFLPNVDVQSVHKTSSSTLRTQINSSTVDGINSVHRSTASFSGGQHRILAQFLISAWNAFINELSVS